MSPQRGVPCLVLLVSGKRKSGKDFVAEALRSRLGEDVCAVLRLSGPLKEQYAQEHGLDFQRLLDASTYKEAYRRDMIRWGEEKRQADPGFFCRKVVEGVSQPIWLVSDTRRLSDIQWFQEAYGAMIQTVRVVASEQSRQQRGWEFTPGVDDAESECGLDNFGAFDWVLENHGDERRLEEQLENLVAFVQSRRRCQVPGAATAAPLPDVWSPTPAEGLADARQARTPRGPRLLRHRTAPPL